MILKVVTLGIILLLIFLTIFRISVNQNLNSSSKFFNVMIFIVLLFLTIQWSLGYYFHQSVKSKTGYIGEIGIQGQEGHSGDSGKCSSDCGRKVCFAVLRTTMDEILKKEIEKDQQINKRGKDNNLQTLLTCIKHPQKIVGEGEGDNKVRQIKDVDGIDAKDKTGKCIDISSLSTQELLNKKDNNEIDLTYSVKNKLFLNKINLLCNSKEYLEILEREPPVDEEGNNKKKPTEKKLILFISNIIQKWIKQICKFRVNIITEDENNNKVTNEVPLGILFLMSSDAEFSMIEEIKKKGDASTKTEDKIYNSPLRELEKYDIWRWGEKDSESPLVIKKCIKTIEPPLGSEQELKTVYTNNYDVLFSINQEGLKDVWDEKNCPYGQMGDDLSNPGNLKYCIDRESNFDLDVRKGLIRKKLAWKTKEYRGRDVNISFLHPTYYMEGNRRVYHKDINGTYYYPVGSVWTTTNTKNKIKKKTILVAGNVEPPKSFEKIWTSASKEEDDLSKHVTLWRPIASNGYVALGDLATLANVNLENLTFTSENTPIMCIAEGCLDLSIPKTGSRLWDSADYSTISYKTEENYRTYNNLQIKKQENIKKIGQDIVNKDEDNDVSYPRFKNDV